MEPPKDAERDAVQPPEPAGRVAGAAIAAVTPTAVASGQAAVSFSGIWAMLASKKLIVGSLLTMSAVGGTAVAVRSVLDDTPARPVVDAAAPVTPRPVTRPATQLDPSTATLKLGTSQIVATERGEIMIMGTLRRPGVYPSSRASLPVTLGEALKDAGAVVGQPLTVSIFHDGLPTEELRLDSGPTDAKLARPLRPNDRVTVRPSGYTVGGSVAHGGLFGVPPYGSVPSREAIGKMAPTRPPLDAGQARRLIKAMPAPAEDGISYFGRTTWVADFDGPMAGPGTGGSDVRTGESVYVFTADTADDDKTSAAAADLRRIGRTLVQLYEDDDRPADIEDVLMAATGPPAETWFSPRLSSPPAFEAKVPRNVIAAFVGRQHDYVYRPPAFGQDLNDEWIVVHEPLDVGLGRVLVLTGDGHVELLPAADAVVRLKRRRPTTRPALPNG